MQVWVKSAPLNSVHVSSYVPLLLRIPLRSLDGFQVGQQQATFFQHLADIILTCHKEKCHCYLEPTAVGGKRGDGTNLHLSVSVGVRVQQELNGASFIWKLRVREFCTKALQHLSDLLHRYRKGLDGL